VPYLEGYEMSLPLVVVEGPAGSGKSTLSRLIADRFKLGLVTSSLSKQTGSRSFDRQDAVIRSWVNDVDKILTALQEPNGAVIDRLGLSQWVYGRLRSPSTPEEEMGPITLSWVSTEQTIGALWRDLDCRARETGLRVGRSPSILLIVIVPERKVLEDRRGKADRVFPWTIEQELELYSRAKTLAKQRSWVFTKKVVVTSFNDASTVLQAVDSFLKPVTDRVSLYD
jgi:thymidylate kinase